ncbi:hypothetical protein J6A31_09480, partial [bacterium]|nr:hypothetical protein [bacterium]
SGSLSGLASGGVFGLGRGLIEDKNPLITATEDAVINSLLGSFAGLGAGKVKQQIDATKIQNIDNLENLSKKEYKQFKQNTQNYYKDYLQGKIINNKDLGEIAITRKGLDEIINKNPEIAKNFPNLEKDLQNADFLETNELYKPRKDQSTQRFHTLKDTKNKHFIAEDKDGNKKFYLTKADITDQGTPSQTEGTSSSDANLSSISKIEPNHIISDISENVNPSHMANANKIFTREEISKMTPEEFKQNEKTIMEQMKNGQIKSATTNINYENYKNPETGKSRVFTREDVQKMSSDEYAKYENEINSQVKTIGLPFEKDLPEKIPTYKKEKSKSYSTSSKDGKWVTINGNHVLIEK